MHFTAKKTTYLWPEARTEGAQSTVNLPPPLVGANDV